MYKVLIIDDDKLARKGLISIVPWCEYGMEIVGDVSNGVKGLEFLEQQAVDLVIVDMSMPVLSGLDFMEECRRRWPKIQFVGLSFHESFDYVQGSLRLGALDYISKIQLEQEDCSKIFMRIRGRLDEQLRDSNVKPLTEEPQEQDIQITDALKREWCKLYWVYDEECFEQLLQDTENKIYLAREMERLLLRISQVMEAAFATQSIHVPALDSVKDGLNWLKEQRAFLYHQVKNQTTFSTIPLSILSAVQRMRETLNQPLHAEAIAAGVNLSRGYFSTNFKLITGSAFTDFLKKERIHLAKKLLCEKKITLNELAVAVGYEDPKYFAHVFREVTGVNCTVFREQLSQISVQDEHNS